jgi:hypothetical protein
MTSSAACQLFSLAGFSSAQLTVSGEAPVPYKLVNRLRLWLYRITTAALGAYLELCEPDPIWWTGWIATL